MNGDAAVNEDEQAVFIYLDAARLPHEIYEQYDLVTLEEQIDEMLSKSGVGELDGNEYGEDYVQLFLYGPDAQALFAEIEPILRNYPLCKNARVVLRLGENGSSSKEFLLQ